MGWPRPKGSTWKVELPVARRKASGGQSGGFAVRRVIHVHEQVHEIVRGAIGRLRAPEPHIHQPLDLRNPEQGPGPPPARHARTRDHPRRRRRCIPRGPGDLDLGGVAIGLRPAHPQPIVGEHGAEGAREGARPVSMSRPIGRTRKRHSALSTAPAGAEVPMTISGCTAIREIITRSSEAGRLANPQDGPRAPFLLVGQIAPHKSCRSRELAHYPLQPHGALHANPSRRRP